MTWAEEMHQLQASFDIQNPFDRKSVGLQLQSGDVEILDVLVAQTAEQKARGMTGRTFEQGEDGMLFVEEQDSQIAFHMHGVPKALLIAWFDAEGDYIDSRIMPSASPWQFFSPRPFRYAIEFPVAMDRQELEEFQLKLGASKLVLGDPSESALT